MNLDLVKVSYQGPPIDDAAVLQGLPEDLRSLLEQINGFIQFGGGLHVRGVCEAPEWHALATVWTGPYALHLRYPTVQPNDIPFAQEALGDQFLLRDAEVYRLAGATGDLESLACGLLEFLMRVQADPVAYLRLNPLVQFYQDGGRLEVGQLLAADPPFWSGQSGASVVLRAVPALERLSFLADLAQRAQRLL